MPATVNVNNLTVVHAGSSGMAMSFPDVCKTPTPAGPVPIPYPNIAQSADTADGSSTVKIDGNPIMLKSSNFKMSSGDEAGSAMGVASNKIKGKALPVNASFDVKVDGKNTFRLTDPMQTNADSSANTMNPAEVQAPVVVLPLMSEECEKVKEKKDEQGKEIAKKNSGMDPSHFAAIEKVAKDKRCVFYFRQTNPKCLPWIAAKHQPKPHAVFKANTIKPGAPGTEVQTGLIENNAEWLAKAKAAGLADAAAEAAVAAEINSSAPVLASNAIYHTDATKFEGVVGEPVKKDVTRKPLKFHDIGAQASGNDYSNKWITGDYDLFQILWATPGCQEVDQKSKAFNRIKNAINKACQWDAIQHGPQAQWVPNEHEKKEGAPNISFPKELKTALRNNDPNATIPIPGRSGMNVVDKEVTVISPAGVVFLEKPQDTLDALKCRECDK